MPKILPVVTHYRKQLDELPEVKAAHEVNAKNCAAKEARAELLREVGNIRAAHKKAIVDFGAEPNEANRAKLDKAILDMGKVDAYNRAHLEGAGPYCQAVIERSRQVMADACDAIERFFAAESARLIEKDIAPLVALGISQGAIPHPLLARIHVAQTRAAGFRDRLVQSCKNHNELWPMFLFVCGSNDASHKGGRGIAASASKYFRKTEAAAA